MSAVMTLSASPEDATVTMRPIQTDDVERLRRMFSRCSRETIYRRFFTAYTSPPEWALQRLAYVDYVNRHAVVAVVGDEIVGVARYDKVGASDEAEIAVCVEDAWQRKGVGASLLEWTLDLARRRGVVTVVADVQSGNSAVLGLLRRLLPSAEVRPDGTTFAVRAAL